MVVLPFVSRPKMESRRASDRTLSIQLQLVIASLAFLVGLKLYLDTGIVALVVYLAIVLSIAIIRAVLHVHLKTNAPSVNDGPPER